MATVESFVSAASPDIRHPGVVPAGLHKMLEDDGHFTLGDALAKTQYVNVPSSREQSFEGVLEHPFNFEVAINMRRANPHLSSCLDALRNAVIGQGLEDEGLEDQLDRMCEPTWDAVMRRVYDDVLSTGIGYLEVVRDDAGNEAGFFWLPSQTMYLELEPRFDFVTTTDGQQFLFPREGPGFHAVQHGGLATMYSQGDHFAGGGTGVPAQTDPRFALYGDKERLFARPEYNGQQFQSEVIVFTDETNLWEHYGAPRFLSAVPYIELVSEAIQQRFDFFHNRGVPDFMVFLRGVNLDKEEWGRLKSALNASSGRGNSGKSSAFQMSSPASESAVDVHRLGIDYDIDRGIVELHDMSALSICSAMRMSPVLAGVTLTGKMGAANETTQALIMLEALQAKQMRRAVEKTLACTLGQGNGKFRGKKFKYASMVDEVMELMSHPAMMAMDTMSRQKGEAANNGGRDLSRGTKKNGQGATTN